MKYFRKNRNRGKTLKNVNRARMRKKRVEDTYIVNLKKEIQIERERERGGEGRQKG